MSGAPPPSSAAASAPGAPAVGYVLRMFPQLSETFVASEIRELEERGVPLRIYSYRRPREAVPHQVVQRIRARVTYLPEPLSLHPGALWRARRDALRFDRARHRRTLGLAVRRALSERSLAAWRGFLRALLLAARVRSDGVRHLHAHFAHGASDAAMLAAGLLGLPFSFSAHARDIYTAPPEPLRRKIEAAAFVLTCTRANQEYLQRLVGPHLRDKIRLAYHGTDVAKFSPGQAIARSEPPLLLAVGRLVAKKGFPWLLDACASLRERGHAFRCLIVGEGPERERLARGIRRLGLGGAVELAGAMSQEQVLEWYRRATAFALPCTVLEDGDRDGIPNVLVEAMAVGLPVVSTPVSGIPELVESGRNGLLVPPESPAALTAALERLLGDAGLREQLGANARRTVLRDFDARAHAGRLAELMLGQLRSPARRRALARGEVSGLARGGR